MTLERFQNDEEISKQMEQFLTLIKTYVDLGKDEQCTATLIKSFVILYLQYICRNKEIGKTGKLETDQIIFNIAQSTVVKIVGVFPNPAIENTFLDYRNLKFDQLIEECVALINEPLTNTLIKPESIN